MKILLAALSVMFSVTTANAFQHIVEYRIGGSQIASAVASDPDEEEGSSKITIMIKDDPRPIVIETDGPTEECALVLQDVVGNADFYVSIIADNNAGTMNGFLILQCVSFPALNARNQ